MDLPAPDRCPDPTDHGRLRVRDEARRAEAARPTTAHRGRDTTCGDSRQLGVASDDTVTSAVDMRNEKRAPMRAALFSSFTRAHGADDDTATRHAMTGFDAGSTSSVVDIDADDAGKPSDR